MIFSYNFCFNIVSNKIVHKEKITKLIKKVVVDKVHTVKHVVANSLIIRYSWLKLNHSNSPSVGNDVIII